MLVFLSVLTIQAQPGASFTVTAPSLNCNPAVYSFTNNSSGVAPLTYQWNFGVHAGVNSVFQNPSTTYLDCGTYTVKLVVTDGNGRQDSTTQSVTIECSPTASFTSSGVAGCIPLSTTFNSTSLPGSGSITNYLWDFGDGYNGTGVSPNHTYTQSGCKNITLVVTNSFGCTNNTTVNNVLCVYPQPVANFTYTSPTGLCNTPATVSYQNLSDSGTAPYTYQWSLAGGLPATSTNVNPSIAYDSIGTFGTTLITTDAHGCADTTFKEGYISIGANTANFSLSETEGCLSDTVIASGVASGTPKSWGWTITPATATIFNPGAQNTSFTFRDSGTYNICLTIGYAGGCTAQKCYSVIIHPLPIDKFGFSGLLNTCIKPDIITFTDSSSGTNLTYNWSFPGGSPSSSNAASPPPVSYNQCGSYSANLTIRDALGCSAQYSTQDFLTLTCPQALFTLTPPFGCSPLDVTFNSAPSQGNPVSWSWNFGDTLSGASDTSSLQNPTHTYNYPGCYTPILTVANAAGCTYSDTMPAAVCTGHKPHANFSANPPVNCADLPVYFTDSSTNTYSYTTYVWDFHGGPPYYNESTLQNPTFVYSDTGFKNISLIVSNYGCADTITKDDLVDMLGPVAIAHATTSCKGLSVFLDGSQSVDAQRYSWVLPEGNPETATTPTVDVTYATTGLYNATLIVYNDSNGCQYMQQIDYPIGGVQAGFYIIENIQCAPFQACFVNTSAGAATNSWVVTDTFGKVVDTSTLAAPCFNINAGVFNVLFIATDSLGCSDSIYRPGILKGIQPAVNFEGSPLSGCTPLTVNFTDSSSLYTRNNAKWQWNFGDNTSSTNTSASENPAHTYNNVGSYTVSLTVTDSLGCSSSTHKINYINVGQMAADFSSVISATCQGTQACLTTDSVPAGSTYFWNFGDSSTSTAPNPCHTYLNSGNFTITLIATDSVCHDTVSKMTAVNVTRPKASFVADTTTSTCPPLQVTFTNLSTNISAATTYLWLFGDGQISSAVNPVHIYNIAGVFNVTLIVTNQNGCQDSLTFQNYIHIGGPSAYVVSPPNSGCVPHLTCMSVSSSSTISYTWNFGDGTVQMASDSVCYTYTRPGTFFPDLILDDGAGCVYAMPVGVVSVSGAYTYFNVDTPFACQNGIFNFTDSTYGVSPVTSLLWSFDDPSSGSQNTSILQNPSHFYTKSGIYNVVLTTTTSDACADSFSRTITVGAAPAVNFAILDSTLCSAKQISFADNTSSNTPIETRTWNFGDPASGSNNISVLPQPTHVYATAGTYNIVLVEITDNGCGDSTSVPVTVTQSPTASFNATDTCLNTQPIVFVNTSLNAIYYEWFFGDGNSSAQANPTHSYPSDGTYKATLIALNSACGDTFTSPVKVYPLPNAAFTLPYNNLCDSTATLQIKNNSTGTIDYSWDFGNGSTSTLFNPSVTYNSPGNYVVTLTARNTYLCMDTASATFSLHQQPVAIFNTYDTCLNTQPIFFTQNSPFATSYYWSFGDGASSIQPDPTHTYAGNGAYNVTFIAGNGYCADTGSATVNIYPVPVASFTLPSPYMCGPPAEVSPDNTSAGATIYTWDFGNGTTSAADSPSISYTTPGTYTISLITRNNNHCADTTSSSIIIYPYPVIQNIAISPAQGCGPLSVTLNVTATNGNQFTWNFGDQSSPVTYSSADASHTYTDTGTYTISLQVISFMNCGDTVTLNDTIKVYIKPTAGFDDTLYTSGQPVNGTVIFTNTSENADSYAWYFGDGDSSSLVNPTHLYPSIDSFQATLIAETDHGCSDSVSKWLQVIKKSLYAPNAFAPDFGVGNGLVKVWKPAGEGLYSYDAQIFDKWGELLWESTALTENNEPAEAWDGTYQGKVCQQDVYVWKIDAVFLDGTRWDGMSYDGSPKKTIGSVTLIR